MRLSVHRFSFAKQETHHVENMRADIHQDESVEFPQKRLVLEHWKAVRVVDVRAPDPTQRRLFQRSRKGADLRLPAPVFIHQQRDVAAARMPHHARRGGKVGGERLLADDRESEIGGGSARVARRS
jgi:hypothetical protein